jgi:preprotein translocase SecE subunit
VRYLYTGYFVAGCVVAYLVKHGVDSAWEGHENTAMIIAAVAGVVAVAAGWQHQGAKTWAMETIDELAAVTWPSKQETYTATTVVLITAVVAALTIFGLDRFWNWLTDLIYLG